MSIQHLLFAILIANKFAHATMWNSDFFIHLAIRFVAESFVEWYSMLTCMQLNQLKAALSQLLFESLYERTTDTTLLQR